MASTFVKELALRRSIYALGKNKLNLSNDQIVDLVKNVVKETPTAFNSQTNRAVVLVGKHHDKLWGQFAPDALKAVVPKDGWASTEQKLQGFAAAYGTVLFFEDTETIKGLQEKFALYAEKFPEWAAHSQGAAAINLWTAFAQEKIGANLQHYNPLIDSAIQKEWNVDPSWQLTGQLVFGSIEAPAGEKTARDDLVKAFL